MLPKRIPKESKRASRWRSPAHCNFVRSFECSWNGCQQRPIEAAHVRIGSGAGLGTKPDDWRVVSLCQFHHAQQHRVGERTFWKDFDIEALIEEFISASPKRQEIERIRKERENG